MGDPGPGQGRSLHIAMNNSHEEASEARKLAENSDPRAGALFLQIAKEHDHANDLIKAFECYRLGLPPVPFDTPHTFSMDQSHYSAHSDVPHAGLQPWKASRKRWRSSTAG